MTTEHEQAALALFLDLCAKNERLCAELYHYYSDLFSDNAEISHLWKKTAVEEENHQKQFELALRLSKECDFELTQDVARAQQVHHAFIRLLDHVRQEPPDVITALQKSIEMEEALTDLHMGSAVRFKDTHVHELFRAMHAADQGHVELLKQFLAVMKLPQAEMVP
jgi:rubrerythrin